jgi:NADH-quinone oxidoreductase subunit K
MVQQSLILSAILFSIGVAGVVFRRNAIILFMCVELMLNAVNLAFVAFSRVVGIEVRSLCSSMTVAAAEAAVGLAIVISIFRHAETVDMKSFNLLRW